MSINPDGVKFDPYFKWLGIPRREQPPHHYRLLGISIYEADEQLINAAADRQAVFIKGCGEAKFPEIADRLIAQIAVARECLLNTEAKAAYDEELKHRQRKSSVSPRKTRYDALQVSAVDTAAQAAEISAENLPKAEPQFIELADTEAGIHLSSIAFADAPVSVGPAEEKKKSKHSAKPPVAAAAALPRATIPPVSVGTTTTDSASDVNTATVIKLVVGGCVLAGGITIGLLTWLSSSSESTSGGPQPAPLSSVAAISPADAVDLQPTTAPAAQAAAPGATPATVPAPVAKTPKAPAAAPKSDAAKPVIPAKAPPATPTPAPAPVAAEPKAESPVRKFEGAWQVTASNFSGVVTISADGTATISGSDDQGAWEYNGEVLTVQFAQHHLEFRPVGDGEMAGTLGGKPAKVVRTNASAVKPAATASPAKAAPAAAPTAPPQPAADAAKDAPDAADNPAVPQSEWVLPLRNLQSFRSAWLKGPDATAIDFDPETRVLTLEGPANLGGFQHKRPWREIHMTLHAETITGQLEIQVNDTTLKLGTATALIRRPATVIISYDPANAHLSATIGTRQVARATVLAENFLSSLTCELRCEGGKTRLKMNELKIKTQ